MLTQRHSNVVACALANKLARTAWAIVPRQTTFDAGFTTLPASTSTALSLLTNHPTGFATTEN